MPTTWNRQKGDALVQAAAKSVAEQYAETIQLPAFGVVFDGYWDGGAGASQLAPLYEVFRTREEIDQRTGNALQDASFDVGAEAEALVAFVDAHGADALIKAYFTALCEHLQKMIDIRVEWGSSEGELRYLLVDD